MNDQHPSFEFDQYQPRETTTVPTPRRGLLRAMMAEVHALSDKVDGKPVLKLSDLAALSDEDLENIRPIKNPECKIRLRDQLVYATPPNAIEDIVLFPVACPALQAFNLFDGRHTLAEVSKYLLEETDWEDEKAWAYTRGLFLKLVNLRVCVPK